MPIGSIDLTALTAGLLRDLRALPTREAGDETPLEGTAAVRALAGEVRETRGEAAASTREVYDARNTETKALLEERQQRLTAYAVRDRVIVPPTEGRFVVAGRFTDGASGVGLPDVRVQAWDLDRETDDLLGETRTDALGYYRVEYGREDLNDPDEIPETYIVALDDAGEILHRSPRTFIDKAGEATNISASVDGSRVADSLTRGTKVNQSVVRQVSTLEVRRVVTPPPVSVVPLRAGVVGRVDVRGGGLVAVDLPAPAPAPVRVVIPSPVWGGVVVSTPGGAVRGGVVVEPVRDPVVTPARDPVVTPTRDPVATGGTVAPGRLTTPSSAVPLTEVAGVGATFATRLEEAGITDTARLAAMEPARVAEVLRTSPARAEGIVTAAGERLRRG